ncbi:hypothetical protein TMatcc_002094 [Talaromyces marneffei ATCC 18224]|uniref:WW domain-containing oxidoreductase n=1 Tax=Talaromyces marneffei PM1 TaxID=1077442 RepID=A0A093V5S5_TALMA|nr:uncharacterized protein EYB26_006728 [Talaromyces marneffei]KAE8552083.1 hypothetical protein EYB25_005977 [Talaromyces marneffei]QGA19043.1 hypothetical protein EYB26_006728 [Talaromyces marneffei]
MEAESSIQLVWPTKSRPSGLTTAPFLAARPMIRGPAMVRQKSAQILFTYGLTNRLKQRDIVSFACHPGSNLDTKLGSHMVVGDYVDILPITKRNTGKEFACVVGDEPRFKTYEQIGATPLIAALDSDLAVQAPAYLQNILVVQPLVEHAYDPDHVEKCWNLSEKLVGQEFTFTKFPLSRD